jgi:hypothetical protein
MGSESVKSMVERLLDRVALLKSPCDLDLVSFFRDTRVS